MTQLSETEQQRFIRGDRPLATLGAADRLAYANAGELAERGRNPSADDLGLDHDRLASEPAARRLAIIEAAGTIATLRGEQNLSPAESNRLDNARMMAGPYLTQ